VPWCLSGYNVYFGKDSFIKLKLHLSNKDVLRGALIYVSGDTIASFILHEFMWMRFAGILFIGATFYAIEIPNYFRWIDRKVADLQGIRQSLVKTGLAILYFNPLWIARHLFFVQLFSGHLHQVSWDILRVASWSFLANIPVSLAANYLIQNKVILKYRFLASALFSALMAVYYAVSKVLF
jgi:hypothetical protein